MTLQTSGPISMDQLRAEFGSTTPISLSQYYAGGGKVAASASGTNGAVPTSGAISLQKFYGVSASTSFTLSAAISANTYNYNLHNALVTAGWNGTSVVNSTVTINAGVTIGSTSTGAYAYDTGVIPAGSTVSIINNGYIEGCGGAGGTATITTSPAGGAGGPAMYLRCNVTITNNAGFIFGGGGGGGAGKPNGVGVGPGAGGGGGGGAGFTVGAGGGGGVGITGLAGTSTGVGGTGKGPFAGTAGGAIGSPGATAEYYSSANSDSYGQVGWPSSTPSGAGGGGGGGGAAGGVGSLSSFYSQNDGNGAYGAIFNGGGGAGGAAGAAITKNGYTITWGTGGQTRIYGTVA